MYDLLSETFKQGSDPLQVVEDSKKEFFVKNLKQVIVEDFEECMSLLKLGELNRTYA